MNRKRKSIQTLLSWLILPVLVGILLCCTPSTMSKEQLRQYIKDPKNGLTQSYNDDYHSLTISFQPSDFIVQQHIRGREIQYDSLESLRDRYSNYYYFILDMSYNGNEMINKFISSEKIFTIIIEELSFGMHKYIDMVTDENDTIPLFDSQFTRYYGMTGKNTLTLVFDKRELKEAKSFTIHLDGSFLGMENRKFIFKISDIVRTPGLKFEH